MTAGPRALDEATVRDLDAAWSNAFERKDLQSVVDMYTDDVAVMAPNVPIVLGKQAAGEYCATLFATPGCHGKWQSHKVEVAQSGDICYVRGTYTLTLNDSEGKPMTDEGKYIEIWKKQTDGTWKVAVDMLNSDLPSARSSP